MQGEKMDNKLKFKRLMFLGATHYQLPAIQKAKELGCIVITASRDLAEIGHSYSDLSLNICTTDKEEILKAAKFYKIDAIMTYAANAAVETVSYVAEKMNLFGNPLSSAEILQDKGKFRSFQKEQNLPYPDFCLIRSRRDLDEVKKLLEKGEVVVKPVDSGGTCGQTIIKDLNEIDKAFLVAKQHSLSKEVIFERKIESATLELDGDVFFQNGELSFALYGHNYFRRNAKSRVPVGEIFPGNITDKIKKDLDKQFSIIINKLNLTAGCMNFDGLVSEDGVYILDIALRNGGNFVPELIRISSGFDMTEASVYAAFGYDYEMQKQRKLIPVASYIISTDKEGAFNGFRIKPSMINDVVYEHLFVQVGDIVYPFDTGDKTLGVVAFKFGSINEAVSFAKKAEDEVELDIDTEKKAKGTSGMRVSSFINNKMAEAINNNDKKLQDILQKQFYLTTKNQAGKEKSQQYSLKHYEASSIFEYEGKKVIGLERLYRNVLVVEPIMQCLANCRHCLRQNYLPFSLSNEELSRIVKCLSHIPVLKEVKELLITGGDPLLIPTKLMRFLDELAQNTDQIKIVRIGSRIPIHQPSAINSKVLALLKREYPFRIEMATQVNHSRELFPEVKEAFKKIRDCAVVYNQTVLLAGVNDNVIDLIDLFNELRYLGIENHYLFHCVPIKEAEGLRTSIDASLKLIRELTTSGLVSGRAKPQLALMTDVGKITLYEGSIIERKEGRVLLQTNYSYRDRLKWNPSWQLPASARIDKNGLLQVWYNDKNVK
jgi:lysine 2,3-aminomutase